MTHWGELHPSLLKSVIFAAESPGEGGSPTQLPEEQGLQMTLTDVTDRRGTSARAARRALRAERAQLLRWRRLVRARLDLAVAGFAPPDPLGAMSWDVIPEAQMALPTPQELLEAIRLAEPTDQVALMQYLRTLDRRLARYGEEIDEALETFTQEIVRHLAAPEDSDENEAVR